jgi:PEGA domain
MTPSKLLVAAAAVALLSGVPAAQAEQRGAGGRGRGPSGHSALPRAAIPRAAAPRSVGAPRVLESRVAPREVWRAAAPRVYSARPVGVAVPARSYAYGARPRGGVVVAPRVVVAPHVVRVAPVRFYRPYYTFRPRFSLGFGLWAGFPIMYPYYYGYYNPYFAYPRPYPYPYPYPPYGYGYPYPAPGYPYPPPAYPPAYPPSGYPPSGYPPSGYPPSANPPAGSVGVQGPNQVNTGGVSFEITPSTAEVFVDGQYMGTVGQFTPTSQPLGLTPGRHHVEIRAPGYRTMDFDVDVIAGQVIPYQGALER